MRAPHGTKLCSPFASPVKFSTTEQLRLKAGILYTSISWQTLVVDFVTGAIRLVGGESAQAWTGPEADYIVPTTGFYSLFLQLRGEERGDRRHITVKGH